MQQLTKRFSCDAILIENRNREQNALLPMFFGWLFSTGNVYQVRVRYLGGTSFVSQTPLTDR